MTTTAVLRVPVSRLNAEHQDLNEAANALPGLSEQLRAIDELEAHLASPARQPNFVVTTSSTGGKRRR